jgi:hypothetical protein
MVFYSKTVSMINRSNHQDNLWDTSSIDSTISSNFGSERPKIGVKQKNTDNHQKWHAVPSGGAKARATSSNYPYPCRYDEYDIYKSHDKNKGLTEKRKLSEKTSIPSWTGKNRNQTTTNVCETMKQQVQQ